MAAPAWLSGVVLPEPERGPRGERVVPYEAVAQAVAMADAAMKAKTRAAQRSALAAASLGFQKGVAASQAAMAQQARAPIPKGRRGTLRGARGAECCAPLCCTGKPSIALLWRLLSRALRARLPRLGALLAPASAASRAFA